jgi:hypothetical protein
MNARHYYISKWSFTFGGILLLVCFATVFASVYFAIKLKILAPLFIAGLFALLIFASRRRYSRFIYLFFTKRPAISLTAEHLIDNINKQTLKWTEITEIEFRQLRGADQPGRYIAIKVANADLYFKDHKSWLRGQLHQFRSDQFFGTFGIQPNALSCKAQDLLNELQYFHSLYGQIPKAAI